MRTKMLLSLGLASSALCAQQYIPNGPDAPDVNMGWFDGYTFTLSNPQNSNNYYPPYSEFIPGSADCPDPFWRFEGYLIFQVMPDFVPYAENLFDVARSRLVAGSDLNNGITSLQGIRHVVMQDSIGNILLDTCYAEALALDDQGIASGYVVTHDAFSGAVFEDGDLPCFLAVAFATNPCQFDSACGTMDAILVSKRSATGPLVKHCVGTVGTIEATVPPRLIVEQQGQGVLLVRSGRPIHDLAVIDVHGRVIRKHGPGAKEVQYLIQGLMDGYYTIAVLTDQGQNIARVVVVQ